MSIEKGHKMDISEKIKEFRLSQKATQKEFADLLGITRAAYSHYEIGLCEISISSLIVLAQHFKVSIDEILGLEF